jgi:hypothetical protein
MKQNKGVLRKNEMNDRGEGGGFSVVAPNPLYFLAEKSRFLTHFSRYSRISQQIPARFFILTPGALI